MKLVHGHGGKVACQQASKQAAQHLCGSPTEDGGVQTGGMRV